MTSPQTNVPDAIGWVLGDTSRYWDPGKVGVEGYYWPEYAPREYTLYSWTIIFEHHDYQICPSAELEEGVEKVAIYVSTVDARPRHVARQKWSGRWTSKVGRGEDIEHANLEGLEGDFFGRVMRLMCRPRQGRGVTLG